MKSSFATIKKTAFILGLSFVSVVLVLLAIELSIRGFRPLQKNPGYPEGRFTYYIDPVVGLKARPNIKAKAIFKGKNFEKSFSAIYTFDQYGWRTVPTNPKLKRDRYLVIYGGSQIFGLGVNDNETIPYYLNKALPNYHIYNFSLRSYSPSNYYSIAQNLTAYSNIQEKEGTVLFHYNSSMFALITKSLLGYSWGGSSPIYELENGTLKFQGILKNLSPIRLTVYKTLLQLDLFRYFWFDPSVTATNDTKNLLCQLIVQSRDKIQKQLPKSRFILAEFPSITPDFQECLKNNHIETISFDTIGIPTIKGDGHFTSEGNFLVAKKLLEKMKEISQ